MVIVYLERSAQLLRLIYSRIICGRVLIQTKIAKCTLKQNGAFSDNVEPVPIISFFFFYNCTALAGLGHFFSSLIYTQSVGRLGRVLSRSQGRYLQTGQHKHRINAHRHPYLERDSKPSSQRSRERRQFKR
jgi:hypothetical protein